MHNVIVARQADGFHALIVHDKGHTVLPNSYATEGEAHQAALNHLVLLG
jgi:hypothetical protein